MFIPLFLFIIVHHSYSLRIVNFVPKNDLSVEKFVITMIRSCALSFSSSCLDLYKCLRLEVAR